WQSSSLQRTNSWLFPSSEVRRRSAMVTVSETTSQRNGLEGGRFTECSPLPAFSHASRGTGRRPARDHRIPSLLCGAGLPSEEHTRQRDRRSGSRTHLNKNSDESIAYFREKAGIDPKGYRHEGLEFAGRFDRLMRGLLGRLGARPPHVTAAARGGRHVHLSVPIQTGPYRLEPGVRSRNTRQTRPQKWRPMRGGPEQVVPSLRAA